jgi:hypothetical protein
MIPAGTKVYLSVAPADLRRSFDGLAAIVGAHVETRIFGQVAG